MSYDQPYPTEAANQTPQAVPDDVTGLMSRMDNVETQLKQHVSEFQRFMEFFTNQMKTHAQNSETAMSKHMESSAAFNSMKSSVEVLSKGLAADVAAIKGKLATLA